MRFSIWMLALVVMPLVGVGLVWFTKGVPLKKASAFGSAPTFTLTERSGKKVTTTDLKGKTWIANFIFTRCSGQCPLLNKKMQKLQETFKKSPNFRSVSFSVEPEHDTPPVLRNYAKKYSADGNRWLFLTGERDKMHDILEGGFKVISGFDGGTTGLLAHTSKFVLINRWGQIQGYYDVLEDDKAMSKLAKDTRRSLLQRF